MEDIIFCWFQSKNPKDSFTDKSSVYFIYFQDM